ncbi:hypothetical protein [Rubrobacter marinus]|nr:hypothetical protein [Rubrobacter marinus]
MTSTAIFDQDDAPATEPLRRSVAEKHTGCRGAAFDADGPGL